MYAAIKRLECRAITRADLVVGVSQNLCKLRQSQYGVTSVYIPNGVDLAVHPAQAQKFREPTLVYAGALEPWTGVDVLLYSMQMARQLIPNLQLLLAGPPPPYGKLSSLLKRAHAANLVRLLGKVSYKHLTGILARSHIGLIPFRPSKLTYYAYPLKLSDYMAAGLPVIATATGEMSRVITEARCGLLSECRPQSFAQAIYRLLRDPALCNQMSHNSRAYAEKLHWTKLYDLLFAELKSRHLI